MSWFKRKKKSAEELANDAEIDKLMKEAFTGELEQGSGTERAVLDTQRSRRPEAV